MAGPLRQRRDDDPPSPEDDATDAAEEEDDDPHCRLHHPDPAVAVAGGAALTAFPPAAVAIHAPTARVKNESGRTALFLLGDRSVVRFGVDRRLHVVGIALLFLLPHR
jgi:hypothetical protein